LQRNTAALRAYPDGHGRVASAGWQSRRSALGCLGTVAGLEHAVELAELAMEETHFGVRTNPRITLPREIVALLRPVYGD